MELVTDKARNWITFVIFAVIVLLFMCLTGCAGGSERRVQDPVPVATKTREALVGSFDERLLVECPELPLLADSTDVAILENYKAITVQYAVCRNEKKVLIDSVRDILNTPPAPPPPPPSIRIDSPGSAIKRTITITP